MKQKILLLFVLVFLLAVSGFHLFIDSDKCCADINHDHDGHSDCPCVFHSNGVVEQPVNIEVDLKSDCFSSEVILDSSKVKFLSDICNIFFFLRSPPVA